MGYSSEFVAPTSLAQSVLYSGNILDAQETPDQMIERVVATLTVEERKYSTFQPQFEEDLGHLMDEGKVVMSTPIMTNAGRYTERPLSACTMPTVDLRAAKSEIAQEIDMLHQQGMGTGFNLTDLKDPVAMLTFLNERAVAGAKSGKEERPVGNMAILHVSHPQIEDFITAKVNAPTGENTWKFNISVDVDDAFMQTVQSGGHYTLQNGKRVDAPRLFELVCESAQRSADPGLIFMDRMNERNPVPGLGAYKTTAPCAEVGLIEGESCQFGYVNLGAFVELDKNNQVHIDYQGIYSTARLMTRALDNALDVSLNNYATDRSRYVMSNKRKVGVGICGVADAISIAGLAYDSDEARALALDLLNLINYASKEESMLLGEERGSCFSMLNLVGNRYYAEPSQLNRLYGDLSTPSVSSEDWGQMAKAISDTRNLRNISTVALPPTGRSALVIDASTGVEAHFTTTQANKRVQDALLRHAGIEVEASQITESLRMLDVTSLPSEVVPLFEEATAISALGHLGMAAALQRATDEAISKTVNLPEGSTSENVSSIYQAAYAAGMSGITVYVNGTFGALQPKSLDK